MYLKHTSSVARDVGLSSVRLGVFGFSHLQRTMVRLCPITQGSIKACEFLGLDIVFVVHFGATVTDLELVFVFVFVFLQVCVAADHARFSQQRKNAPKSSESKSSEKSPSEGDQTSDGKNVADASAASGGEAKDGNADGGAGGAGADASAGAGDSGGVAPMEDESGNSPDPPADDGAAEAKPGKAEVESSSPVAAETPKYDSYPLLLVWPLFVLSGFQLVGKSNR